MKHLLLLFIVCFYALKLNGQVKAEHTKWLRIGSDQPLLFDKKDENNGDGQSDGCYKVNILENTSQIQGVKYIFNGQIIENQKIKLSFCLFKNDNLKMKIRIQLYNLTDHKILAKSTLKNPKKNGSVYNLNYATTKNEIGDEIEFQIIQENISNKNAHFSIDWAKLNDKTIPITPIFLPIFDFDLPLQPATSNQLTELNEIYSRLSDNYLDKTIPNTSEIELANAQYERLNINVLNGEIKGNPILESSEIKFLKTYAQLLKSNTIDSITKQKAINTVWFVSNEYCNGSRIISFYDYKEFCNSTIFLRDILPENVKSLFEYTLFQESDKFNYLFSSKYDEEFQKNNQSISSDVVYLILEPMFAYSSWLRTDNLKIRFLTSLKRYLDRFLSYSYGTGDGIKKDGLGFHHWTNYDGYMYTYGSVSRLLNALSNTSFQVEKESYLHFRDALYAQLMYTNDFGLKPFSMSGRHPQVKLSTLDRYTLKNTLIEGGNILGLQSEDPILAMFYNKKFGIDPTFKTQKIASFEEGFIQFNYGNLGIYRKNNWIVSMKGFNNCFWGAEIYETSNRYGRYQSYGALEIIYPGDEILKNGFKNIGWNWNFNPGTTTIVLPWSKLQASTIRIDERNKYGYAGSLAFLNKKKEVLSDNFGTIGMFGMRFREQLNQGFETSLGEDSHNKSFEFNKAYFAFDEYIICLGNSIKNNDKKNKTVTTLFQRLDINQDEIVVNGTTLPKASEHVFIGTSWIIDNFLTGYFIGGNSTKIVAKNDFQRTPYQDQVFPSEDSIKKNDGNFYNISYIDHGLSPKNANYEYVIIPSTSPNKMAEFSMLMKDSILKPYTVFQNDYLAQIILDKKTNTFGYSLPIKNKSIQFGLVKRNSFPCMLMYRYLEPKKILFSISNPDLGIGPNSYEAAKQKNIQIRLKGKWKLEKNNENVRLLKQGILETELDFLTKDGLAIEIILINE